MRVDAEIVVAAWPDIVWDLLADITNTGIWSPECIRTAWLDDRHDVRPGARFTGHNRIPDLFEWTVTCVVTEAVRPRTLAWVVLDDEGDTQADEHLSSRWRYDSRPLRMEKPSSGTASCTGRVTAACAG
jgi:uncharacterized protein YndB with AHSA1/START domain